MKNALEKGHFFYLTNNRAQIYRSRVSNEWRLEIYQPQNSWYLSRQYPGLIQEKINYRDRFFIPTGEKGLEILNKILQDNPVSRVADNDDAQYQIREKTIEDYQKEAYEDSKIDRRIIDLVDTVKSGKFNQNDSVDFGIVLDDTAVKIEKELGVDVSGFHVKIEARQIYHILKRHGERGQADMSMRNDSDIARIMYTIENADSVTQSGISAAYPEFRDGKNRPSKSILYEKEIGAKSYYVVEAVPNTKKKTLFIVTAFIGEHGYKNNSPQSTNAISPGTTPYSAAAVNTADSVSRSTDNVNQYQQRTSPLTNRKILSYAAEQLRTGEWTDGQKDALRIFKERLDKLEELQSKRTDEGRLYKEQQFGGKVDRAAAAETLNRMHILDAQISRARDAVLDVEEKKVLREVLEKARTKVEQVERQKGKEQLDKWRQRKKEAQAIKKYRERITRDVTDMTKWAISPSGKDVMKHIPDALG